MGNFESTRDSKDLTDDFRLCSSQQCPATSISTSSEPRRPYTTPANPAATKKGGIEIRVNNHPSFKGSYVNNRTRTMASKFSAPGFNFLKAYEEAGFPGYTAGTQNSPCDSEGRK